jgi:hypothetical protein
VSDASDRRYPSISTFFSKIIVLILKWKSMYSHGTESQLRNARQIQLTSTAAKPLEIGGKLFEPTGFKDEEMASGGH